MSTLSTTTAPPHATSRPEENWNCEDPTFWASHKAIAYRTLVLSILALHLAFAVLVKFLQPAFLLPVVYALWKDRVSALFQ